MKKTLFTLFLAGVLSFGMLAQTDMHRNGIAVRGVLYDYLTLEDVNPLKSERTFGVDLTYLRHLNQYLNLAVPLRYGPSVYLPQESEAKEVMSADLILQLKWYKPDALLVPYLFAGVGGMKETDQDLYASIPAGAGMNVRLGSRWYLNLEGQYRTALEDDRNGLQYAAGLIYNFSCRKKEKPKDSDGDGVMDADDRCPTTPGVAGFQGCPDRDNDGIPDLDDLCPLAAGSQEMKGCPDKDNDGVADYRDKCPETPGIAALEGCPDRDDDGVADINDRCPDTKGNIQFSGCPDRDGDRIPDLDDECPDQAGTDAFKGCPDTDGDGISNKYDKCPYAAGPEKNNGCPEITVQEKEKLDFAARAIQFETNSAVIKPASYSILDEVAEILKKYTSYRVSIDGHTDSIGDAEKNQKLSANRAKACFDYLAGKGVDPSRMSHQGFGESKPVASNINAAGRMQNRRVEFNLAQN